MRKIADSKLWWYIVCINPTSCYFHSNHLHHRFIFNILICQINHRNLTYPNEELVLVHMAMMSSLKELVQNQSLLYYCINPDPETLSGLTGYEPDEDNGIYCHDSQSVGYCDSLTVMLISASKYLFASFKPI